MWIWPYVVSEETQNLSRQVCAAPLQVPIFSPVVKNVSGIILLGTLGHPLLVRQEF